MDVDYKDKNGNSTGTPNRKLAAVMAYENLRKPNLMAYLNSLLEEYGYNDDSVEKQHLFLLNQYAELNAKAKAIDMYYKIKGKYAPEKRDIKAKGEFTVKRSPLEDATDEELKLMLEQIRNGKGDLQQSSAPAETTDGNPEDRAGVDVTGS